MTNSEILSAIGAHDWEVRGRVAGAPSNFGEAIGAAASRFDPEARQLAVECLAAWNGPGVGSLLLKLTADSDPQTAAAAANALGRIGDRPPMPAILADIPTRPEPFVRGQLYKLIGSTRATHLLPELRKVAAGESSADAQRDAQRALVMLGGQEEREAFKKRVAAARPDEALDLMDDLLAIGDQRLAKSMLPWLSDEAGVTRLGGDRRPSMARMCDVAVWTMQLLKIPLPTPPTSLDNYPPEVITEARTALASLPI
jgi:hypothetical protein